jgi:hypothetical protein
LLGVTSRWLFRRRIGLEPVYLAAEHAETSGGVSGNAGTKRCQSRLENVVQSDLATKVGNELTTTFSLLVNIPPFPALKDGVKE